MNSLSLYVEKWYIVGAICTGNGLQRIVLPNGEDRIWLFFFEDIANDRIFYGKNNKKNAQNREPHYYQDVFSQIVDSEAKFKKFGRDYPLSDIFKYSNVLEDLKTSFAKWASDEVIPTYLSFSQDISFNAQSIFKEQLQKNGFEIIQYVGKVDFLALEWLSRTNRLHLPKEKKALVLKSSNENLHMSVFSTDGNLLVETANDVLKGYGNDVRRHAVIEDVIKQGNSTLKFLTNNEEYEHEMKRMEDMVEDWILRLDSGRKGIPVRITDINFSLAPANKFTANLKSNIIDERTKAIIRTIIDYVKKFVTDKASIHEYDLGAVILIGNSFENNQYSTEIDRWLQIHESNMFNITEDKLPDVVGVYSQIPDDYFSADEKFFGAQSEQEKALQAKNEKDRLARENAEKLLAQQKLTEEEKSRADKAYKDAMDQYYEAESKRDYENMREFLSIALSKKPGDSVANEMLNKLEDIIRKDDIRNEQFHTAINEADKAFDDGDNETAFRFYTQALTIEPDSDHAKKRIEEIKKKQADYRKAIECLTKADVFEGEGLLDKALTELKKAQLLDPSNTEISGRVASIEKALGEKKRNIKELSKMVETSEQSKDFSSAIVACENLIELDVSNKAKWERKLTELQGKKRVQEEKTAIINEYHKKVETASFDDKWDDVFELCTQALTYEPSNDFFLKYLEKSKKEKKRVPVTVGMPPKAPKNPVVTDKPAEDPFFSDNSIDKSVTKKIINGPNTKESRGELDDDFFGLPKPTQKKQSLSEKKSTGDFF